MASEAMNQAKQFCRSNLKQCCDDMADWDKTGVLRNGKLRELSDLCSFAGHSDLAVAKGIVTMEAIRFVSGLPDNVFANNAAF